MEIEKTGLTQMMYGMYAGMSSVSSQGESESGQPCLQGMETMDISGAGKMHSAMSQLSEEEQAEMQAFHDEMIEAVENGTFDAAEMAANAPEALKTMAEENGLDLETMLEEQSANIEEFGDNPPPPPPPMMYGSDGSGISDSTDDLTTGLLDSWFSEDSGEETIADMLSSQV